MPSEKFYGPERVEGDGQPADLNVSWGTTAVPGVYVNGVQYDRSGLNRLIGALRKARDQVYGADE